MFVSVVVPIFNSEKNLRQCIESILLQTYRNFELLLIDDGSQDNSLQICEEFSNRDNRVKIFHQANSGVGSARNKGIELSTGEYIMFVDSDDYLDLEMLQDGVDHMKKGEDLYISGTMMEYYKNNAVVKQVEYKGIEKKYSRKTLLDSFNLEYPLLCIGGPCSKLFRTDLLNRLNCRFDTEMSVSEDSLFCWDYIVGINEISFSEKCYYHYRRDGEDSLWSRYTPRLYEFQCRSYGRMREVLNRCGCDERTIERFEVMYFNIMVGCIQNENKNKNSSLGKKVETVKKIADNEYIKRFIINHPTLNKKEQLIVELFRMKKYKIIVWMFDIWNIWKKISKNLQE